MFVSIVLTVVISLLIAAYLGGKWNEAYWKRRSVAFYTKNKFLGAFWDFFTKDRAFFENLHDIYKDYPNEPAVGIGSLLAPTLYIRDPTNYQHVLATDFSSFNHRGFEMNEEDLLADNLIFINGKKWKLLRQSMSPLFTSTRLKSMYYIIDKSAQDFVKQIKETPTLTKGNTFSTLSTFCSAAISAAVFGISTTSIFDSPFLTMAQNAFKSTFLNNLKFSIATICPTISKALKFRIFKDYEEFFIGAISQAINQRKIENTKKHDFADICVSLQESGTLRDNETGYEVEPTNELFAAQAFFFFNAGVEPTATSMFTTLVLLGQHPEILDRIHKEIDDAFKKSHGNMTYDIIAEMEYLDMVMSEAMRFYPPIGFLTRQCIKDTTLPVGNIRVDKGTKIWTPIFEIHRDPKYYPNPEVFDPERFSRENKKNIKDITYLPFGKGNRICIGMRYATLQAKAGLVHLLRNYSVKTITLHGDKTEYKKEPVQVRIKNLDVHFIERNITL